MAHMQPHRDLSAADLDALRRSDAPTQLIDVREPWEFNLARIDGAELRPLGDIYEWAETLDREQPYVVMCHHGSRSAMACAFLRARGFKSVSNLEGGIDAWSTAIDPRVPRY
jgi:rhodanese-related sulfurtransferase